MRNFLSADEIRIGKVFWDKMVLPEENGCMSAIRYSGLKSSILKSTERYF